MGDWELDRKRFGKNGWIVQPAFWAVAVYRYGRWTLGAPRAIRPVSHALYTLAYLHVRFLTGIDIPRTVDIGPGLMIHHFGGVIVHPQAKMGANCTLRHGVTIGVRRDGDLPPTLGDGVVLGAYAQILGNIHVGSGAVVGALSLVMADVPPGAVVAGIPAKQIH